MDTRTQRCRGEAVTAVLLVLTLLGVGFVAFKPKALDGDSRRAQESEESTAQLIQATEKQGAVAAASVAKIGEVAATLDPTPEKSFITKEVPVALASLPPPDPQALLEAEKRKAAVLTGQLSEVRTLYSKALAEADELSRARDEAEARRVRADQDLSETAAARLAMERQRNQFILIAAAVGALVLWLKFSHFSPGQMSRAIIDIRNQKDPVTAIDVAANPLQQKLVANRTPNK